MSSFTRVFMDIAINKQPAGRLVMRLFSKDVPKTAENFRALWFVKDFRLSLSLSLFFFFFFLVCVRVCLCVVT